jgi:hypothetical protein
MSHARSFLPLPPTISSLVPRALGEEKPAVACACYIDNSPLNSSCYCDVSLYAVSQIDSVSTCRYLYSATAQRQHESCRPELRAT